MKENTNHFHFYRPPDMKDGKDTHHCICGLRQINAMKNPQKLELTQ